MTTATIHSPAAPVAETKSCLPRSVQTERNGSPLEPLLVLCEKLLEVWKCPRKELIPIREGLEVLAAKARQIEAEEMIR